MKDRWARRRAEGVRDIYFVSARLTDNGDNTIEQRRRNCTYRLQGDHRKFSTRERSQFTYSRVRYVQLNFAQDVCRSIATLRVDPDQPDPRPIALSL